jgi:hypothetical protein
LGDFDGIFVAERDVDLWFTTPNDNSSLLYDEGSFFNIFAWATGAF